MPADHGWHTLLGDGQQPSRPLLMGILNVTPDSFTDGGQFLAPDKAVDHAETLIAAGADIIDIGGESTRPGATPVSAEEECARIIPVIKRLANCLVPLSVDTRQAMVMDAALKAGAQIINDVSALSHDPDALSVAVTHQCPIVLMHMRGTPETMNQTPYPDTANILEQVASDLKARIDTCIQAGIKPHNIAIDPGIGFGKTPAQNRLLLAQMGRLTDLGYPVLMGASRKFARPEAAASVRLATSIAAAIRAVEGGAALLRVHDVAETAAALALWRKSR